MGYKRLTGIGREKTYMESKKTKSMDFPDDMFREIQACANETGNSDHGAILFLIKMGLKLYNAPASILLKPE